MRARFWKLLETLRESFWVVPAVLVLVGIALGALTVAVEKSGRLPEALVSTWLYGGGDTGARTLLGAIASSTIGVVGTVFSITIAALTLASSQMGPRLLRNFTRDRGNQFTLGIFLGTFAFALVVLRSVRGQDDALFVPHLAVTIGMLLAFLCVAMLVYFVHHMADRINVDTVIGLVHGELSDSVRRLTLAEPPAPPPPDDVWRDADPIRDPRSGYLQQLDEEALADWAERHDTAIRLLVRPGDFVFPGACVAEMVPAVEGAGEAIRAATALGPRRALSMDLEFAADQLAEVATRALSPGINDPFTAIAVLDLLGATLCDIAPRHLPGRATIRGERAVLVRSVTTYSGLVDAMFHKIRQNAGDQPSVLIRMVDVLTAVASCEKRSDRRGVLRRHVDLVVEDGMRLIGNPRDKADLMERERRFRAILAPE